MLFNLFMAKTNRGNIATDMNLCLVVSNSNRGNIWCSKKTGNGTFSMLFGFQSVLLLLIDGFSQCGTQYSALDVYHKEEKEVNQCAKFEIFDRRVDPTSHFLWAVIHSLPTKCYVAHSGNKLSFIGCFIADIVPTIQEIKHTIFTFWTCDAHFGFCRNSLSIFYRGLK